ncbi:hypothetical protein SAMN05444374_10531 [Rhodococcoides kroppenstedtii]|uniref:Uncharacterized protein n=1 Tax=Rhodococcoides kroppenstedtii TaxID=293050 RepID=A0A1I0TAB6_9NOCA|nr:hypothetical protein [Rhodococcus kroppenstedtii]SFA48712.1 hypothetical protein SAMN05444374_10531 [Rhodococcus kroppenstedtii]
MSSPSASLAIWSGAWLGGRAAPDDVLDALARWAPLTLIVADDENVAEELDLPWPTPRDVGSATLLSVLRLAVPAGEAGTVELVLPVPGDVAGLPTGTTFAAAALTAGEGVMVGVPGGAGIGLVPTVEGPDVLRWTVFRFPQPHPRRDTALGEVEYAMREVVREAADVLGSAPAVVTRRLGDPHVLITERLAAAQAHPYPPLSERITRVLDTADRVDAILDAADVAAPSQAPTSTGAETRETTVRSLRTAVRTARRVAVTDAVDRFLHS